MNRHSSNPGFKLQLICMSILSIFIFQSCDRMILPPRPADVPEGAARDKIGLWNYYYPDGLFRKYFSDGSVIVEGRFRDGVRQGIWKTFLPGKGNVTSLGAYLNNWRDGKWEHFDTQNRLYLDIEYRPEPRTNLIITTDYGNENGPYHRYFPDGKLEEIGHYRAGQLHGTLIRYYRNGNLAAKGQYDTDRMTGKWEYYYPEGGLERIENYQNGIKNGKFINYYPDGSVYHETEYKNNERSSELQIHSR